MFAQLGVGDIRDVAFATIDHVDFFFNRIDAGYVEASIGESDCQRQPDIAETDYGDICTFLLDFLN